MNADHSNIYLIERAGQTRTELSTTFRKRGYYCFTFDSVAGFLAFHRPASASCLVVSLEIFKTTALGLQEQLNRKFAPPVVFITDGTDLAACVHVMREGAVDVLRKSFDEDSLLHSIGAAIRLDAVEKLNRTKLAELRKNYERLTPRERQVLPLVADGLLNKQTAAELGTSEITICVHRGQIMRKMAARSLPELVRMVDRLGVEYLQPRRHQFPGSEANAALLNPKQPLENRPV